jgi:hypothetical protein
MGASFAFGMSAPAINVGRLFHRLARSAAIFSFRYRATAHRVRAFLSFGRHMHLLSRMNSITVNEEKALRPPLRPHLPAGSGCCSSYAPDLLHGAALQCFPLSPCGFRRPVDLGRDRAQRRTDAPSNGYKRVIFGAAGAPVRFRVHSVLRFGLLRMCFGSPWISSECWSLLF